ncbi:MAG TPA: XRE family transcriptional regulator [Steroidobacteraceae bacterium]|nr:XRE family transcriptional regulator [Steroidobacteraceae bacterium]
MIGKRLKLARAASGLSLRGLQGALDDLVTAQAIGKYERDESMPSSGVLLALCRALQVTPEYLAGDPALVLEGVEFRKKLVTRRKEEASVQAQVLQLIERYLTVESILGLRSQAWEPPRGAPFAVRSLDDAERAAETVREQWGLGQDPIPHLAELLEERGIKVLPLELDDVDGFMAEVSREGKAIVPVVVVNARAWGERQRFTLAHELGHLLLRPRSGVDAEAAAHRFAGAFLLPAETLRAQVGRHRQSVSRGELLELKRLFGISLQALTYRCRDLGIFPDVLFRSLFREFSRRGWRSPPYKEPGALQPEPRPRRFERLCYRALAEGAISDSKAAELLSITVRELRSRLAGTA